MLGHSVAVLFALATTSAALDKDVASSRHDHWAVGQRFEIQTADWVLRGQLVDGSTGRCQVSSSSDGENFSSPRTVYLLGATAGPQDRQTLVLMGEIKVGMKLELGVDDLEQKNRLVTGEVRSIRLD